MKTLWVMTALGLAFTGWPGTVVADPWKDESGKWRGGYERHGDGWRKRGHDDDRDSYKEEFRIGGCEVKREWTAKSTKKRSSARTGGDLRPTAPTATRSPACAGGQFRDIRKPAIVEPV